MAVCEFVKNVSGTLDLSDFVRVPGLKIVNVSGKCCFYVRPLKSET